MEYIKALGVALASPVTSGPQVLVDVLQGFTLGSAILDFAPLLYVTVLPLLAAIFAVLGLCNRGDDRTFKFGARTVMRRVMIAVRAEARMGLESKHTHLLKRAERAGALEAGKSQNQSKR